MTIKPLLEIRPSCAQSIFLIEDDRQLAQAIIALLNSVSFSVMHCSTAETILTKLQPTAQGCILLDVRLSGMSGLKLQEKLKTLCINLPIIFMTGYADVHMATQAMKKGAFDFITKPFNNQQLIDTIQTAFEYNTQQYEKYYLKQLVHQRLSQLTPREKQVMHSVVDGKISKTIAQELGISTHTVELHRTKLMRKMQVRTLGELIKIAVQYGLFESH